MHLCDHVRVHLVPSFGGAMVFWGLLAVCGWLPAQQQVPQEGSGSHDPLPQLIAQLGSNDFAQRRAATRELLESGSGAIPAVTEAARSANRETQGRALGILQQFAAAEDLSTRTLAQEALHRLARDSNSQVARAGENAIRSQSWIAVQFFRQAGGRVELDQNQVVTVNLANRGIGDAQLQPLRLLPGIRELDLRFTPLTNAGLVYVQDLAELRICNLQGTQVDDDGMARLSKLHNLESLSIERTRVSDRGLSHFRMLTNLKTLYAGGSDLNGAGLGELADLPLTYLSFQGSKISDSAVEQIVKLKNLRTLGLDDTRVTDTCLPHLQRLPQLEVLWLDSTGVTDAGVEHLAKLNTLKTLHLKKSLVTSAGYERLRSVRPALTIHHAARTQHQTP